MKVFIGADHAGYALKEKVKVYLERIGISVEDCGPYAYEKTDDYPDYALKVAKKVRRSGGRGILFCNNGVGICIAANKVRGIRAVSVETVRLAKASRSDDDTNVLCLGGAFVSYETAKRIIKEWLKVRFRNAARDRRRLKKVQKIERGQL